MNPTCGLCDRLIHGAAAQLCGSCAMATVDRLAALPALYRQLEAALVPAGRPQAGRIRGSRTTAPAPANLAVIDARSDLVRIPVSWQAALHDDLTWAPPLLAADPGQRLADAVRTLRANILWIAEAWPAAGDFAREIRDVHRGATTVTGPRERAARLGPCPTVKGDGETCGAVLRVRPGEQAATCRWCHTVYPPSTWAAIGAAS